MVEPNSYLQWGIEYSEHWNTKHILTPNIFKFCFPRVHKTGLQPVSRPVEQVPLLRGLGVDQSSLGALFKVEVS